MGEKLARHIERCLRLPTGWMDQPNDETTQPTSPAAPAPDAPPGGTKAHNLDTLMASASPRSLDAIKRIAAAADAGRLTEADVALLNQIAERFARKE
jgi:hypothetical protein